MYYMRLSFLAILFLVFGFSSEAQRFIQIGTTSVKVDTVITGIDVPWEIKYANNNQLWLTERRGRISRVDLNTSQRKVVLNHVSSVIQQSESGMLGLTLHPQFPDTPFVYVAYTYSSQGSIRERISRFTYANDSLVDEYFLLNNLPGNGTHNGCRLLILEDKTMLITTGDVQNLSLPQDTFSLMGKVLRLHLDGSIPADNPFNNAVYSIGHRNAQGIAILPNDTVVLSEHGATSDDELHLLYRGRNYGWPSVEGFCNTPTEQTFCNNNQVIEPLVAYTPTLGPSDIIYYTNRNFPEWDSCVLMTVLKDKEVRAIKLNSQYNSVVSDVSYLKNMFGRLRDIEVGPNKEIYIATNGASWANTDPNTHTILRLTPPSDTSANSISDVDDESMYGLYPNPTSNEVFINFLSKNLVQIEVYNTLGVLVDKLNELNQNKVDVSRLSNGIYYFSFLHENGKRINRRLIVRR